METGFLCIHTYLESKGGGEGAVIRGGACLILWPRGWALVWREGTSRSVRAYSKKYGNLSLPYIKVPFLLSVVLVC